MLLPNLPTLLPNLAYLWLMSLCWLTFTACQGHVHCSSPSCAQASMWDFLHCSVSAQGFVALHTLCIWQRRSCVCFNMPPVKLHFAMHDVSFHMWFVHAEDRLVRLDKILSRPSYT